MVAWQPWFVLDVFAHVPSEWTPVGREVRAQDSCTHGSRSEPPDLQVPYPNAERYAAASGTLLNSPTLESSHRGQDTAARPAVRWACR